MDMMVEGSPLNVGEEFWPEATTAVGEGDRGLDPDPCQPYISP